MRLATFSLVFLMMTNAIVSDYRALFQPNGAASFCENETLKTVFQTRNLPAELYPYQGTPLDEKGRYLNLGAPMTHSFRNFLRWQLGKKPQAAEKKADTWQHTITKNTDFLNTTEDGILWLGHATYFLRLNGVTLLIDPIFGGMPFVPRKSELPFSPDQLPKLDYILLSHNHRDHADASSMQQLLKNPKNKKTTILTGLSMEKLVKPWARNQKIQTAGWWQQFKLEGTGLEITFTPTQHWARRGLTDLNEMLWGGFMIEQIEAIDRKNTIYFGGDSGYSPLFGLIGEIWTNISIAMIGCGAYKPDFIMQSNHTSPDEALQAANDCNAKMLLPMHYGTFDLSDEPFGEPFRRLTELKQTTSKTTINLLQIGDWLPC